MRPPFPPLTPANGSRIFSLLGSLFIFVPIANAADFNSTWTGPGAGTAAWEDADNWSSAQYPQNDPDRYRAQIGDATGERIITTAGDITLSNFGLTQTSAGGRSILKLGGNLNIAGALPSDNPLRTPSASFSNTTADSTRLVIDLQGHHLNVAIPTTYSDLGTSQYFTIRSQGVSGGVFSVAQIYAPVLDLPNVVRIEDDVTVRVTGYNANRFNGYTWSDGSTLQIATNLTDVQTARNLELRGKGANSVSNLVLGDESGIKTEVALSSGSSAAIPYREVRNNVTIHQNSRINLSNTLSPLAVGGDFTDTNVSGNYGSGTLLFNGGADRVQNISIARTGLQTAIQIGSMTTAHGLETANVLLHQNLSTASTGRVLEGSHLNVATHTFEANGVLFDDGAHLTLGIGEEIGLVRSTGDLALSEFHLKLDFLDLDWNNGDSLLLFEYEGNFLGAPEITSFSFEGAINVSYDQLFHDTISKTIYLSNVQVIPEPSSFILLGVGVLIALKRTRRRP